MRGRLALAGLVWLAAWPLSVGAEPLRSRGVTVLECSDGDTCKVDIELARVPAWGGFVVLQAERVSVRLLGVDTPEIRGHCPEERALALRARAALRDYLQRAAWVELRELTTEKYGRLMARVVVGLPEAPQESVDVGERLVEAGLARAYKGEQRGSWCPQKGGKP